MKHRHGIKQFSSSFNYFSSSLLSTYSNITNGIYMYVVICVMVMYVEYAWCALLLILCNWQSHKLCLLLYYDNFFLSFMMHGSFVGSLLQEVIGSTCIFIALHRSMLRLKRLVLITYYILLYCSIIFQNLTVFYHLDLLQLLIYVIVIFYIPSHEIVLPSCLTFAIIHLNLP